jgi:small-conductance mechanosensitive channel
MFRYGLLALAALLAWIIHVWTDALLLFDDSFIPVVLRNLAAGLTAALGAMAATSAVLDLGLRQALGIEPSGAQRVIIGGLIVFAASALTLHLLGQDITAILTTSAIITAVIGFALQPTLGGLFSGVALQLDRHLKVGSGIIYKGEDTRIESMNWRSVIGRRRDHSQIIIPNALLASEAVEVYPEDRATRRDTYIYAPVSIPPQRIAKLVRELVGDLTYVEGSHPVMVSPVEQLPDIAALKYRVRYRVAYYFEIPEVEGEVLRRIWYGFQRHDIPLPVSRLYPEPLRDRQTGPLAFPEGYDLGEAVRAALPGAGEDPDTLAAMIEHIRSDGRALLYGPAERIIIPTAWTGRRYLLAAGELTGDDPEFADRRRYGAYPQTGARRLFVHRLSESAQVRRLADLLAERIGPYAELAVKQAAGEAEHYEDLCRVLAEEIADEAERKRFLDEAIPEQSRCARPGLVFTAARDVSGQCVSQPHYRAVDEAVILALPKDLTDHFPCPGAS